jgi:hypothetical protein
MGATDKTIFAIEILAVLKEDAGEPVAASHETSDASLKENAGEPVAVPHETSDASKMLETFDFEQAPSEFKRKVFKKKLEWVAEAFEGRDPQSLSEDSVNSIKDALNHVNSGFYTLLEDNKTKATIKAELEAVLLSYLIEAQAHVLVATTLLDEGKGRNVDYYVALLKCKHQMFKIKQLVVTWKFEKEAK